MRRRLFCEFAAATTLSFALPVSSDGPDVLGPRLGDVRDCLIAALVCLTTAVRAQPVTRHRGFPAGWGKLPG